MIITVTMNPAIDKTVEIDSFIHGGLNRITRVWQDAGGKGVNVSKTIHELGGHSVATGFISGRNGTFIEQTLKERGIDTDFVQTEGETRTNTKVIESDGTVTELNEAGPVVSTGQVDALFQKLDGYADEQALFVLSGSVPTGVSKRIYKEITERVRQKGARVLIDADGELFVRGLSACPDIVKPNKVELEEYYGMKVETVEGIVRMGNMLMTEGIGLAAISCGEKGAVFLTKDEVIYCKGLQVEAHSTVGAGDAMVAAIAYGLHDDRNLDEIVRLGIATSAGAVMTTGTNPPSGELVKELMEKVTIKHI